MKKHVLIIGYVWVEPNSSAAGSRMLQLIQQFLLFGYEVTFASAAQKSDKAVNLTALQVNEVFIELNATSFDDFIKSLKPSIVMFDRFMMEEQFGWRVAENCPDALRILDTEDLHCLRKVRQEKIKKGIPFAIDDLLTSNIAKREIAAILRCDVSLIISSFELEVLKKVFKIDEKLLLHLPFLLNPITDVQVAKWIPFSEREHFVFVGNFLHAPNVDAVLQLKKIWGEIKDKLPKKIQLHIYGAYVTQQIHQLHNEKERFIVKGFIENIETVIERARVVIAPIRFGAGIKGKLTEAMVCGTPSITTTIGAEGMHDDLHWNGLIIDNFQDNSERIIKLYTDEEEWKQAQKRGVTIINQLYNKDFLRNKFAQTLSKLEENLVEHRKYNFLGSLLQYETLQATKYMSKWIEQKNKKE